MMLDMPRRRVLVAAGPAAIFSLRDLFSCPPLMHWEPVEADSFAKARFVMQHHPCEIMLVNEDLYQHEGDQALDWLTQTRAAPLIFLAGDKPSTVAQAYQHGAHMCLSRAMALACPALVATALDRAVALGEKHRTYHRLAKQLAQCRRHMDRLVHLIWRSAPADPDNSWCTQRHALERLHEEVARTQRHGGPLTLAVGEVQAGQPAALNEPVAAWTTEVLARAKRRCDVAGQYGLRGFLLLMVQTPTNGGVLCCRRLQRLLQTVPPGGPGPRGPLRACFGLAASSPENTSPQCLLRFADKNLEMAKAGKNEGVVAD